MFVGIFYYIDGEIINETVELNYAENYGDFKIYKGSHFDMWRKVLEKKTNKPYDYFPRGRVVYNYNERYFRMFIDKCINKPETIAEIKQVFGIKDEEIELIDNDLHYVCNRCNRYFIE